MGQEKRIRDVLGRIGMKVRWRWYGEYGHGVKELEGYDDLVTFLGKEVGLRGGE